MKTVEQVLRRNVVTIDVGATVADVTALMLDRNVSALPVVDGERLVGLITMRDVLRAPPYRPIAEVMPRDVVTASAKMSVTVAYTLMDERSLGQLPVVDDDRLVGLVTREDILRELGQPIDPLTGLPWATTLRELAVERLKDGDEIAIIFLDLDNFGLANKQFGHVAGDQYIKAVAEALLVTVNSSDDLLCRYGGDEFAILTRRQRDDAEDLGRRAVETVTSVRLPGAKTEFPITASMGLAGGKRTTERQDIHFAATVDDLITIASLQSTQAKIEKARRSPHLAELRHAVQPRMHLRRVDLSFEGREAIAAVELSLGSDRYRGEVKGPSLGTIPLRLLAESTVQAVNKTLPPGWIAAVDEVRVIRMPSETLLAATILLGSGEAAPERHTGCAVAGSDPGSAVVKATLQAINRRLSRLLV